MKSRFSLQNILRLIVILVFSAVIISWFTSTSGSGLAGQEEPPTPEATQAAPTAQPGAPVELNGKVLFYIHDRIGSILPVERALLISQRLNDLTNNPFSEPVEISIVDTTSGTDIMAGDMVLMTVSDADAISAGKDRTLLAEELAATLQAEVEAARQANSVQARLVDLLINLGILAGLIISFIVINRLYRYLSLRVDALPVTAQGARKRTTIFRSGQWKRVLKLVLNIARYVILITLVVVITPLVLSLIPATHELGARLIALLIIPFARLWVWFGENQGDFIIIGLIVFITYGLHRLSRWFFKELGRGSFSISGFDPEWAEFTSRMVTFFLIIAALVIAFPYIPGSDSEAFRGISIFLGFLFTLSSTAAISNIIAGVIQTYTGAFRVGDIVQIGAITGVVSEKSLLTTRVRTFKNEEVSIPNSLVLSSNVTNYSIMARAKGVVLYKTVTIGYDAPWRQVHELLIAAALATPYTEKVPAPYVLQTALNDWHVSYQINLYTKHPERMMRIYSLLNANIQDHFNKAGVEIMSPSYFGVRDGNTVTIPEEERPQDYRAPGFRIEDISDS